MTDDSSKKIIELMENMQKDFGAMQKNFGSMQKDIKDIQKTQREHTMILKDHTKMLNEHTVILKDHTKTLKEHSETLTTHTSSLVVIETTNKIYGDMYEINNDNIRRIERRTEILEKKNQITPEPENILMELPQ